MHAFVLVQTRVHDADGFETYRRLAGPSVQSHGGSFVAKGAALQALEGGNDWPRIAVIRFESQEVARSWFTSPAYQQAVGARSGGVADMALTLFG